MNEEKVRIYLQNVIASVEEEMDPIHYCPLCQKPCSVQNEEKDVVTLICDNHKCKMVTYEITMTRED